MLRRALASIHFEKYSTATATYLKLPGAVGRGPTISMPHRARGQTGGYEMDFFGWEFTVVSMLLTVRAGAHDFVGVRHC